MPEVDHHMVRFYERALHQPHQSEQEGRPVYRHAHFVEIRQPGQDKDIVDREVKESDKERWPTQWAKYKRGQEQTPDGTALSEWPCLNVTEVARLKSLNIHTVEQLATLDDLGLQKLGPGARDQQRQAKYFLEEAVPASTVASLKGQSDRLLADAEALGQKAGYWLDDDAAAASGMVETLARHAETAAKESVAITDRARATVERFEGMAEEARRQVIVLQKGLEVFRGQKDRQNAEREAAASAAEYAGDAPAVQPVNGADAGADDAVLKRLADLEAQNKALFKRLMAQTAPVEPQPEPPVVGSTPPPPEPVSAEPQPTPPTPAPQPPEATPQARKRGRPKKGT